MGPARSVLASKYAACVFVSCAALACSAGVIGGEHGEQDGALSEDAPGAEPSAGETQAEGTALNDVFAQAAGEFDVPAQLLKSLAWVETQAQMVVGEEEFPGRPAAFGMMALRGEQLEQGAALAGVSVDDVKNDPQHNVRAAAALLSASADVIGIDRGDLGDWAEVVADHSGILEPTAVSAFVHDEVYAAIKFGVTTEVLTIDPDDDVVPYYGLNSPSSNPGPDYPAAHWRASPNYSSRPSGSKGDPQMVIIHTCEGSYSGCWSWLKNSSSGVSAHYVVNNTGSEISQLVKESKKAWHISATYKCSLNDGVGCNLNGYGSNNFTIGIEHAGYANQASWTNGLIHSSAQLVCDITEDQGIPIDSHHIVGHGQLQPYNRIDPGPNWPWSKYMGLIKDYCGGAPTPPDEPPDTPDDLPSDGTIIVDSNNSANGDNAFCDASGTWTASNNVAGFFNTGYFWRSTGASSDLATFKAYLPSAQKMTIDVWWPAASDRSPNAPFIIFDGDGVQLDVVHVDQQKNGGKWVELGTYNLAAGWNKVALSRWTTAGYVVVADAVRFRPAN